VFAWDTRKAIQNFEKHRVSFEEATTIFADPKALHLEDTAHSQDERRFKRLDKSLSERVLLVIYAIRRTDDGKDAIRIISARQASRKERKAYGGQPD